MRISLKLSYIYIYIYIYIYEGACECVCCYVYGCACVRACMCMCVRCEFNKQILAPEAAHPGGRGAQCPPLFQIPQKYPFLHRKSAPFIL